MAAPGVGPPGPSGLWLRPVVCEPVATLPREAPRFTGRCSGTGKMDQNSVKPSDSQFFYSKQQQQQQKLSEISALVCLEEAGNTRKYYRAHAGMSLFAQQSKTGVPAKFSRLPGNTRKLSGTSWYELICRTE
ncbi:hypothetical protein P5673_017801 [Acropora cervicornis]|uniref:Uncharacterized protein n=1 Tax=Acropora cervicornis TaxID=6130 RepID=A0AAD9V3C9_ACRCE|nr:hypothetical protein P5673_017801 [Acropora cervicornis]